MIKQYPIDVYSYDFKVKTDIQLRFSDIDGFGHTNNSAMQSFFDLGRAAYMSRVCGDNFHLMNETLLVVSYTTDFLRQIHFEDQIEMCVAVHKIGNKSVSLLMAIRNKKNGEICAVSDSIMAGFDRTTQKSIPIPSQWREKIAALEGKAF